jgi:hypothetical protein
MPNHPISVSRRLAAGSTVLLTLLLLGAERFSPALVESADNGSHPDSASAVATVERFHAALAGNVEDPGNPLVVSRTPAWALTADDSRIIHRCQASRCSAPVVALRHIQAVLPHSVS